MNEKWTVIANPAASGGKAKRKWPDTRIALSTAGIEYEWMPTDAPGDGALKVQKAIRDGNRKFISVGGDGTHHEVVNGFCRSGSHLSSLTLGIIPIGTGNDWARTLGVPHNLQQAANIIGNNKAVHHRAGCITFDDGRKEYFMNIAGMCMDAAVVRNVPASLIGKLGGMAYLLGGVKELLTYASPEASIAIDGQFFSGKFLTIHAGFGKFSGGGMQFLPHADSSSNTLAITTIDARSKWKLLLNIHRLFTGTILSLNAANAYTATCLRVQHTGGSPVPVEADGEFLGHSPFEISVLQTSMKVCVPFPTFPQCDTIRNLS